MSAIFFRVTTDNPDGEPCVEAIIYDEHGIKQGSHVMTVEGATIRMHDMHAAVIDARGRRARLKRALDHTGQRNLLR